MYSSLANIGHADIIWSIVSSIIIIIIIIISVLTFAQDIYR
jgi:hypothetical protein